MTNFPSRTDSNTEYWKARGQAWRSEPEIDVDRQKFLSERRSITPDFKQGIYPFRGIELSRADVEWLLATHENGRGPVLWDEEKDKLDENERRRGLDLRGADLHDKNLDGLLLSCLRGGLTWEEWDQATIEQREMAYLHLEGASLCHMHLEGAILSGVILKKAILYFASLDHAFLRGAELILANFNDASLQWVSLHDAHLEGASLRRTCLQGAELKGCFFSDVTYIEDAVISNGKRDAISAVDVRWDNVNLALVNWQQMPIIGNELAIIYAKKFGTPKNAFSAAYLTNYETAIRAYRQLAEVLRGQGSNEDANHFAHRAQILRRLTLRRQWKLGAYIFSWFLALLTGYGYRPERILYWYVGVISLFTVVYYVVSMLSGSHLVWNEALIISLRNFQGAFFSGQFKLDNPLAGFAALEAFCGLFVEAGLIAAFTQRLFGK